MTPLSDEQKELALGQAARRLLEARPHLATLAEVAHDPWAERQLEGIDAALRELRREAKRLASERPGASPQEREEAARRAEAVGRYFEARTFTARIEAEFTNMLSGLMVDPITLAAEQRIGEALITIRAKYGEAAAEHCRRMLPAAPEPAPENAGVPSIDY